MIIFTARKRSLGQGNIFTSVCHSFCPRGGEGLHPGGGGLHPGGVLHWGGSASRVSASRGSALRRDWADPLDAEPPWDTTGYGQRAGGTYTTETKIQH